MALDGCWEAGENQFSSSVWPLLSYICFRERLCTMHTWASSLDYVGYKGGGDEVKTFGGGSLRGIVYRDTCMRFSKNR